MSLAALPFFKKPKSPDVAPIPQRTTAQEPADVVLGSETEEDIQRKKKGKRRFQKSLAVTTNKKSGLNTGK